MQCSRTRHPWRAIPLVVFWGQLFNAWVNLRAVVIRFPVEQRLGVTPTSSDSASVRRAGLTYAISVQCSITRSPCPIRHAIKCSSVAGSSGSVGDHAFLALQLPFMELSESMGNHDSKT